MHHFLLLFLKFQGFNPLSLVFTIHLLSDWTLLGRGNFFFFLFHKQLLVSVEYLIHFLLEIQKFVAFDGFVIFYALRVKSE